MSRIGGSTRVRDDLARALELGRKVTAKIQWLSKIAPKSRARWIHCTPLLGVNDAIGVWMVILVDDDDEVEELPEMTRLERTEDHLTSTQKYEALPWDVDGQKANSGVTTTIWSDTDNLGKRSEESFRPNIRSRRPLFQQPTDTVDQITSASRPGPRIAGKAYSLTPTNDGHVLADNGSSVIADMSRPPSSNTSGDSLQSTMQPKIRIAGRSSIDGEGVRRAPINMPYRPSIDASDGSDARVPSRRTYKSLSPYGILFEE